jgi:hypothetical protein
MKSSYGGNIMKVLGVISVATLFLLLGTAVPVFAQDEHHDEAAKPQQAKPAQHEEQAKPAQQAKPEQREAQPKSAQQQPQAKPEQRQQQAKPASQQQQAKPERQQQAKAATPQHQQPAKSEQAKSTAPERQQQASNRQGQPPQRSAADQQRQRAQPALRLSARSESRIPDARFQSNFGSGHRFRIGSPTLVGGYSRFQYGGYWFGFVQPWPANWYYTDDVYVVYTDGGYYLCDPSYPGTQIAISVVL